MTKAFVKGFVLGTTGGLIAAFLYAPRPGPVTRAAVGARIKTVKGTINALTPQKLRRSAFLQAGVLLDRGIYAVETHRPQVEEAVARAVTLFQGLSGHEETDQRRDEPPPQIRAQASLWIEEGLRLARQVAQALKEASSQS